MPRAFTPRSWIHRLSVPPSFLRSSHTGQREHFYFRPQFNPESWQSFLPRMPVLLPLVTLDTPWASHIPDTAQWIWCMMGHQLIKTAGRRP